jgi:DNA-3-methyladenine glycosylase II
MGRNSGMKKALAHLRSVDPVMRELIDRVGPYRMRYGPAGYASLLRAIMAQQLSTKAAATIHGRLVEACGGKVEPAVVLSLGDERLRAAGISSQKIRYVKDLSEKTLSGAVDFGRLASMSDQEVLTHLTAVKGVGVWTAQMFMIFALRRQDVYFPVADLGLRNAMQGLYRLPAPVKAERMLKIAAPWRPYSSVACWYLWRSLDGPAVLE